MRRMLAVLAVTIAAAGCGGSVEPAPRPEPEPSSVTVEHILISFKGIGTRATRTREEAQKLAHELLARARKGEDFTALIKEFSDDVSGSGVYRLVSNSVPIVVGAEFHRRDMVVAFGDVAFLLKVGEIGLAPYHSRTSPYGYHIIRRIR